MRYLLSSASLPALIQLAKSKTLCAFDFDGTLAPIVAHPDRARMRERTRILLSHVTELYPCVVVSGRARPDLLRRLGRVGVAGVIGNHGAETERTPRNSRRQVRQWKAVLESVLGALPGVWIEDKGLSLAVHYRQSPRKAEVRRRIIEVARGLKHANIFGGKYVVNITAIGSLDKGDALAYERSRLNCDSVLYVGDDENDETAFSLKGKVLSVRIGRKRSSRAKYFLRDQTEIDELLRRLSVLRVQ